jgi:hypothetical protein
MISFTRPKIIRNLQTTYTCKSIFINVWTPFLFLEKKN